MLREAGDADDLAKFLRDLYEAAPGRPADRDVERRQAAQELAQFAAAHG